MNKFGNLNLWTIFHKLVCKSQIQILSSSCLVVIAIRHCHNVILAQQIGHGVESSGWLAYLKYMAGAEGEVIFQLFLKFEITPLNNKSKACFI